MNAEQFYDLLIDLNACEEAREWAQGKTWQEVYNTCHRGDWLLWLFERINPQDRRALALAKGHCANTVRHLMSDERSLAAIDAAIAYGEGRIDEKELKKAASDAYAALAVAVCAVDSYAADSAADAAASFIPSYAAHCAADAVYAAAYNNNDDHDDSANAADANRKLTADICRKYLPIEIWNIK
jgi:hypothetical protein